MLSSDRFAKLLAVMQHMDIEWITYAQLTLKKCKLINCFNGIICKEED